MRKVLYVLIVLVVIILAGAYWLFNGMGEVKRLEINEVDLSKLADGVYEGSFQKGRWNYNVAVTVKDHAITGIELINPKSGPHDKFHREEIAKVIERQSVKVDAVSGATVSSNALLKAIENALGSTPR